MTLPWPISFSYQFGGLSFEVSLTKVYEGSVRRLWLEGLLVFLAIAKDEVC